MEKNEERKKVNKSLPDEFRETIDEFDSHDFCDVIENLLYFEESGVGDFTITEMITCLINEMNDSRRPVPTNHHNREE
jgi:hypothetical protein